MPRQSRRSRQHRPGSRASKGGRVGCTAAWMALTACLGIVGCSASGPVAPPTTTRHRITSGADARDQIDQMQRRGDCLELQSAYLTMKSTPILLANDPTRERVDQFRDDVEHLGEQMPDVARADFETVAKAYDQLIAVLEGADLSDPAKVAQNAPKARDALRSLDDPAVKAAEQRLETFFRTCPEHLLDPGPTPNTR